MLAGVTWSHGADVVIAVDKREPKIPLLVIEIVCGTETPCPSLRVKESVPGGDSRMAGANDCWTVVMEVAIARMTGPGIGVMSLTFPKGDVTSLTSYRGLTKETSTRVTQRQMPAGRATWNW